MAGFHAKTPRRVAPTVGAGALRETTTRLIIWLRQMRRLADFLTDNLACVIFVVAAGWAVAFAAWAVTHAGLLENFLFANQLPPEARSNLLWLTIMGPALALGLWLAVGVVAITTRRRAGLTLQRGATLALPLTLLAFLPVLSLPTLATERPFLTFALIAGMASIAFLAVQQASRLSGPAPEWTHRLSHANVGLGLACGLAAAYAVFMSALTVTRHNAFMTHSFDLGIHDQIVYNALHHGILRSTQHGPHPINYLGNHFAPILYLVAPLYALRGDARTLLVLQSLCLGLGAVPIYLLARNKLHSSALAVALSASYLLFPALHGVNTFDFHQIALVTSLLLWGIYCLETGRTKCFLLFLVLAVATKEEVGLTAAAFGVYLFLVKRRYGLGAALTAGGIAYFTAVVGYVMPALGGVPQVYRFKGLMAEGAGGLTAVATTLVTNPLHTAVYIFGDARKLEFLCLLLLPVLFLPLLAGRSLILAVPAFSVALLASAEENFRIGTQYPAIMVPFVSFLAIAGIQKLDPSRFRRGALAAAILVASLGMNAEYGWLCGRLFTGFPQPTPHQRVVKDFFSDIPRTASVSTLSDLVPHLSSRETIYLFPTTERADYILFDAHPTANFWPFLSRDARHAAARALAPYLASGEYGVARADDWTLLLRRGHDTAHNDAALRLLFSSQFEAENLASDFTAPPEQDSRASGGQVRVADWSLPHAEGRSGLTYGPYVSLLPGKYRVTYWLRIEGTSSQQGPIATLDIFSTAMGGPLAGKDVMIQDFAAYGNYQGISVDVEIPRALDDVEYRVLYRGPERLWADRIEVTPLQATIPIATYEAEKLPGDSQVVSDPGASKEAARATEGTATTGALAYGPYVGLIPGRYRAMYALRLAAADPVGKVATVEVYSSTAGGPLASRDVEASEFAGPEAYQEFTLDLEIPWALGDVEYRVLAHGPARLMADRVQVFYLLQ